MIAYSENELYNNYIGSQAKEAFETSEISKESFNNIEQAYTSKLYAPHFFIALALGLLTLVAVIFTGFLFWLLTNSESSAGIRILCAFMAVLCYILLEWSVKSKQYFNAGVDNALMVLIPGFTSGIFISVLDNPSWIVAYSVLVLVSLWLSVRFVDAFMALISCCFFLTLCFVSLLKFGNIALINVPFVMMFIIAAIYFLLEKAKNKIHFMYEKCTTLLTIFLLIAFYAAGNYWVIVQLHSELVSSPVPISFGWVFWIFTGLVPVMYVAYGLIKRSLIHLRTGLFLVAMTIFTYKLYYTFLPVEVEMLILGLLLIALSYFLIRLLQPARYGFTAEIISPQSAWKNMEAVVIAETVGVGNATPKDSLMAGGSGGGGGASGEF